MSEPTLGAWDQVLAITQQMINAGLTTLYKKSEKAQTEIKSVANRNVALENFVFDVPEVVIPHTENALARGKVLYCIFLKSGRFQYYTDNDPGTPPSYLDAKGWSFAIPTDLELQEVTDDKIRNEKMKELNVGSDYSIGRLLVAIGAVNIAALDMNRSNLPKDLDQEDLRSLASLITVGTKGGPSVFWEEMKTLGWTAKKIDPSADKSHPPTFVPKETLFETSSWYDPQTKIPAGTGVTGNSILNYLLYKQTTGDHQLPEGNQVLIWAKSNWTPGSTNGGPDDGNLVYGRFYMSRKNFFDNWLVPRLAVINRAVHMSAWDMYLSAKANGDYVWDVQFQMGGAPPSEAKRPDSWVPSYNSQGSYWSFWHKYGLNPAWQQGGATISIEGTTNVVNHSKIEYTPNSNRITMFGSNDLLFYCQLWNGIKDTWGTKSRTDRLGRRLEWEMYLDLVSVKDGGLQINVTTPKPTWNKNLNTFELGRIRWLESFMDNQYKTTLELLTEVQGRLAEDLNSLHKLYLPAGGRFYYANPTINSNGDLICDVKYTQEGLGFLQGPARSVDSGRDIVTTAQVGGERHENSHPF